LHIKRHGKILERTIYTPNEFIINGNIVEILIYNRKQEHIATGIVSIKHLDKIKKYKWSLTKEGYILSYLNKEYIYLHRLITEAKPEEYVDHINHDTLNNLDENLRLCTNSQNLQNHTKLPSDNTSGIIGVCWINEKNKWRAEIQVNKNKIHLGYFDTFEDAVDVRIQAEAKYFKEFKSDINNIKMEEYCENN